MPAFDVNSYIDVQQRVTRFWEEYPDGRIETMLMSLPDDFTQCRFKASVYKHKDDAHPAATGWAFEVAGGSGANRTSHEENGETSSLGRALANMGYATSLQDRPSRQEMEKVARNAPQERNTAPPRRENPGVDAGSTKIIAAGQEGEPPATPPQLKNIDRLISKTGKDRAAIKRHYHVAHMADLSKRQASECIEVLMAAAGEKIAEVA